MSTIEQVVIKCTPKRRIRELKAMVVEVRRDTLNTTTHKCQAARVKSEELEPRSVENMVTRSQGVWSRQEADKIGALGPNEARRPNTLL